MSERTMARATAANDEPLIRDIATFIRVVGNHYLRLSEADTVFASRRPGPTQNMAYALRAAWNTLVTPPDEDLNMPILRTRAAAYLAGRNIAMAEVGIRDLDTKRTTDLAYLTYDIMSMLNDATPGEHNNALLLADLHEELTAKPHRRRYDQAWESEVGKLVMPGLLHVLPRIPGVKE